MTREMNNSVETVNAAATAIVTAESRVQQATIQKRRWGGCWSIYWCFGSHRHPKRIGHAVLAPEPNLPGPVGPDAPENQAHQPTVILPFIAPPSSPASFIQSEPPSATHSPAGLLSLTSLSASVYSPRGPRSIFAVGPYAHEKQLVSPPVFSTFTTEPSTAPFTPPPEPVHLTTPSSPEVPFAQLLTTQDSNHKSRGVCREFPTSQYEFQSYQLYPGSPVGHLISPNSAFSGSGTSSPFPDLEFPSNSYPFPPFGTTTAPNLLSIDSLSFRKSLPRQASSISATSDSIKSAGPENLLLEDQISALASIPSSNNGLHNDDLVVNHRVSFELSVANCMGNELDSVHVATSELDSDPVAKDKILAKAQTSCDSFAAVPSDVLEEREARAGQPSVGTLKEFKFDNADGASAEPTVDSDWWANEKVVGTEPEARNNWAFFPMIQPGVS